MTTEQDKAYEAFVSDPAQSSFPRVDFFVGGWHAGRLAEAANVDAAHSRGRADERAEIERKLLVMAGQAFVANRDDHAHWFRSLVNVLFKNRDDSKKPGDTSA